MPPPLSLPPLPRAPLLHQSSLSSLLLSHLLPPTTPILLPTPLPSPLPLPNPQIHLPSPSIRTAAHWALSNGFRDLILPAPSPGLEMLPPDSFRLHTPLTTISDSVIHSAAAALPKTLLDHYVAPPQTPPSQPTTTDHHLDAETDPLLTASILSISHWGYLVLNRALLHDPLALHCLSRILTHISGTPPPLRQLRHLLSDLLVTPPPKGRTAGGVVVRPLSGVLANTLRRKHPAVSQDDMLIFLREPDQENSSLHAKRLRGIATCAPLYDGRPVYWDNRFVISTGVLPMPELDAGSVFKACVSAEGTKKELDEARFYVRQMRRADWHVLTATTKVNVHVPFECIRALPAVFEKGVGLVGIPHLGMANNINRYFVAVRMPRYRCLPADLDPAFVESHVPIPDNVAAS